MGKKSREKKQQKSESSPAYVEASDQAVPMQQLAASLLMQAFRHHQQAHLPQAAGLYDQVLQLDPLNFDALHLRGVLESDRGAHEAAVELIGRALRLRPSSAPALQNMGVALRNLKRFDEAETMYKRALQQEPNNPELANNLGNVLLDRGKYDEALSNYEHAIALAPHFADAHDGRGNALREMHRFEEALVCYATAQTLAPDSASAHWNEGLCHLISGRLLKGWAKYEWGWPIGMRGRRRTFAAPLWLGNAPLQGSTILLYAEQGFGDTIQFCRYVREVAALGARVILEVQAALKPLLSGLEGADSVLAYGEELPAFDWQCPLLSLPLALQTDLTSIPASKAYVHADPALVRKWSGKLGARQGLRIGIAWSGSTQYSKDYQRSASLTDMLQLRQPGIQLFSLQKSLTEEEQLLVERCADVRHLGEDFSNTAALASLMDVVISVDTSIAHLSAALGCPTWVLLPHTPDWRWMLGREESPWYPTARLFRQSASGGWSPVIDRVGRLLQKMLADADIVLTDFPEEP